MFAPERRIYRIDRIQLGPGGIRVRALVYFLGLVGAALLVGRLPGTDELLGWLPWPVWTVAIPAAAAAALVAVQIDGRSTHSLLGPLASEAKRSLVARFVRARDRRVRLDPGVSYVASGARVKYVGPGWVEIQCVHQLAWARSRGPSRAMFRPSTIEVRCLKHRSRESVSVWVPRGATLLFNATVGAS